MQHATCGMLHALHVDVFIAIKHYFWWAWYANTKKNYQTGIKLPTSKWLSTCEL